MSFAINKKDPSAEPELLPRFWRSADNLAERGSGHAGKLADHVCVARNPFADISRLKDVLTVLKGAVFLKHKAEKLPEPGWV